MKLTGPLALLLLAVIPIQQHPAPPAGAIPMDAGWTLRGERTRIVKADGRDGLQVESGFGDRKDVRLLDGTIDFDVRLTSRRSFVYLFFRAVDENEREEFYIRPHKSNLPDAVQYAPVWQGKSAWQLHHGDGGTAAVPFADDRWTHVRAVLSGRHAALFVDDMKTPALLVPWMSREPQAGYISLGGFLPADVPGSGPIATFANVAVSEKVDFDFKAALAASAAAKAKAVPAGVVREWSVSPAFAPKDGDDRSVLPAAAGEFQRIPAEPGGLVQLHRHVKIPAAVRVTAAVARITVTAASAAVVPFDLGFSDIATVFVNGVPVFTGDQSYSFDKPRREGLIGFDQARVYLPLKAGANDVAVLVSDSFGGWGIMGRFPRPEGLQVAAR